MNPLAVHTAAMSNFYGVNATQTTDARKENHIGGQDVFRYTSMIVGLLSLFTIIALNVTNIIYLTESGGTMESIKNSQQSLSGSMKETTGILIEDLKPKTDLINSMVGYNIPTQLSLIYSTIKNDVLKQCTPTFMFNNTICPVAEHPIHSSYFEEINLSSFAACALPNGRVVMNSEVTYTEYPSFIPGSTSPGSCVRLPSFSLSPTIFAYSHTIMGHGCSELDVGDHYFSLGRIADHGHENPVFETITEWFINDKVNRRSCTVAAGQYEGWMGCVIMTETFLDDLSSRDTGRVSITYLDVYGRKREWIYTRSEIRFDQNYASLYFSVGSGVVIGDNVHFLIWGNLYFPIEEPAFCTAPQCRTFNQQQCNQAQRPEAFGGHQMVNGILSFKTTTRGKPVLSVRTFSPKLIPLGTEGRLIHFQNINRTYIYLRSTGWHALPLTGRIIFTVPLNIEWIQQTAVSRPGRSPCGASSRCPQQCVTGVYTDLFPMGPNYEYSMTAFLDSETDRVNPTLAFINTGSIIYRKTLTQSNQKAGYTTTTCFIFKLRIWCLSIVELSPSTITEFEPVPFLYQLDVGCRMSPSGQIMPLSYGERSLSIGPYKPARKECYLEQVGDQYYLIISIPNSIQAYTIRDLDPEKIPHTGLYINDICPVLLNVYTTMSATARMMTAIMVGQWQFRPVNRPGGTRVNLPNKLANATRNEMYSPEDPGHSYYVDRLIDQYNYQTLPEGALVEICLKLNRGNNLTIIQDIQCRVYKYSRVKSNWSIGPTSSPTGITMRDMITQLNKFSTAFSPPLQCNHSFPCPCPCNCSSTIGTTKEPLTRLQHNNSTHTRTAGLNTSHNRLLSTTIKSAHVTNSSKRRDQDSATHSHTSPETPASQTEKHHTATHPHTPPTKDQTGATGHPAANETSHHPTPRTTTNPDIHHTTPPPGNPQPGNTAPHPEAATKAPTTTPQPRTNHTADAAPQADPPQKLNPTEQPIKTPTPTTTPTAPTTYPNRTTEPNPENNDTPIHPHNDPTRDTTTSPANHNTLDPHGDPEAEGTTTSETTSRSKPAGDTKETEHETLDSPKDPHVDTTTSATTTDEGVDKTSTNTTQHAHPTPKQRSQTTDNTTRPDSPQQDTSTQTDTPRDQPNSPGADPGQPPPTDPPEEQREGGQPDNKKQEETSSNNTKPEDAKITPDKAESRETSKPNSSIPTKEEERPNSQPLLRGGESQTLRLSNIEDLHIDDTSPSHTSHSEVQPTPKPPSEENPSFELIDVSHNNPKPDESLTKPCYQIDRHCTDNYLSTIGPLIDCYNKTEEVLCRLQTQTIDYMEKNCPGGYLNTSMASILGVAYSEYGDCRRGESLKPGHNYICMINGTSYLADREFICRKPSYKVMTNLTTTKLFHSSQSPFDTVGHLIGKYPFSYQEFIEWAGHYYPRPTEYMCGLGEFCGYTFVFFLSPDFNAYFEPTIYYKSIEKLNRSPIQIYNLCGRVFEVADQLTEPYHNVIVTPLKNKVLILRSLSYNDFADLGGNKTSCDTILQRRAYFSVETSVAKEARKNKGKLEAVTKSPNEKITRMKRATNPSYGATPSYDTFGDLILSALESLWYKRR
ncbi:G protein [Pohorje myodes paramyxovirus 1]|uniref:G protein n=1 Tax=Pohorje myodes paramyxovirus 1 TaxID=2116604 RepID=A0A2P1GJA9_9MONO|nr:G protein [Pohorje myodes paramyxovirus 1]AVM86047.1 G protein [Pohorje myodes paramyxovirus 1]